MSNNHFGFQKASSPPKLEPSTSIPSSAAPNNFHQLNSIPLSQQPLQQPPPPTQKILPSAKKPSLYSKKPRISTTNAEQPPKVDNPQETLSSIITSSNIEIILPPHQTNIILSGSINSSPVEPIVESKPPIDTVPSYIPPPINSTSVPPISSQVSTRSNLYSRKKPILSSTSLPQDTYSLSQHFDSFKSQHGAEVSSQHISVNSIFPPNAEQQQQSNENHVIQSNFQQNQQLQLKVGDSEVLKQYCRFLPYYINYQNDHIDRNCVGDIYNTHLQNLQILTNFSNRRDKTNYTGKMFDTLSNDDNVCHEISINPKIKNQLEYSHCNSHENDFIDDIIFEIDIPSYNPLHSTKSLTNQPKIPENHTISRLSNIFSINEHHPLTPAEITQSAPKFQLQHYQPPITTIITQKTPNTLSHTGDVHHIPFTADISAFEPSPNPPLDLYNLYIKPQITQSFPSVDIFATSPIHPPSATVHDGVKISHKSRSFVHLFNRAMFLDKMQSQAVNSLANSVSVLAGPGAGKTRTLISRLLFLIFYFKINTNSILAITFTKNATQELQKRFNQYYNILYNIYHNFDVAWNKFKSTLAQKRTERMKMFQNGEQDHDDEKDSTPPKTSNNQRELNPNFTTVIPSISTLSLNPHSAIYIKPPLIITFNALCLLLLKNHKFNVKIDLNLDNIAYINPLINTLLYDYYHYNLFLVKNELNLPTASFPSHKNESGGLFQFIRNLYKAGRFQPQNFISSPSVSDIKVNNFNGYKPRTSWAYSETTTLHPIPSLFALPLPISAKNQEYTLFQQFYELIYLNVFHLLYGYNRHYLQQAITSNNIRNAAVLHKMNNIKNVNSMDKSSVPLSLPLPNHISLINSIHTLDVILHNNKQQLLQDVQNQHYFNEITSYSTNLLDMSFISPVCDKLCYFYATIVPNSPQSTSLYHNYQHYPQTPSLQYFDSLFKGVEQFHTHYTANIQQQTSQLNIFSTTLNATTLSNTHINPLKQRKDALASLKATILPATGTNLPITAQNLANHGKIAKNTEKSGNFLGIEQHLYKSCFFSQTNNIYFIHNIYQQYYTYTAPMIHYLGPIEYGIPMNLIFYRLLLSYVYNPTSLSLSVPYIVMPINTNNNSNFTHNINDYSIGNEFLLNSQRINLNKNNDYSINFYTQFLADQQYLHDTVALHTISHGKVPLSYYFATSCSLSPIFFEPPSSLIQRDYFAQYPKNSHISTITRTFYYNNPEIISSAIPLFPTFFSTNANILYKKGHNPLFRQYCDLPPFLHTPTLHADIKSINITGNLNNIPYSVQKHGFNMYPFSFSILSHFYTNLYVNLQIIAYNSFLFTKNGPFNRIIGYFFFILRYFVILKLLKTNVESYYTQYYPILPTFLITEILVKSNLLNNDDYALDVINQLLHTFNQFDLIQEKQYINTCFLYYFITLLSTVHLHTNISKNHDNQIEGAHFNHLNSTVIQQAQAYLQTLPNLFPPHITSYESPANFLDFFPKQMENNDKHDKNYQQSTPISQFYVNNTKQLYHISLYFTFSDFALLIDRLIDIIKLSEEGNSSNDNDNNVNDSSSQHDNSVALVQYQQFGNFLPHYDTNGDDTENTLTDIGQNSDNIGSFERETKQNAFISKKNEFYLNIMTKCYESHLRPVDLLSIVTLLLWDDDLFSLISCNTPTLLVATNNRTVQTEKTSKNSLQPRKSKDPNNSSIIDDELVDVNDDTEKNAIHNNTSLQDTRKLSFFDNLLTTMTFEGSFMLLYENNMLIDFVRHVFWVEIMLPWYRNEGLILDNEDDDEFSGDCMGITGFSQYKSQRISLKSQRSQKSKSPQKQNNNNDNKIDNLNNNNNNEDKSYHTTSRISTTMNYDDDDDGGSLFFTQPEDQQTPHQTHIHNCNDNSLSSQVENHFDDFFDYYDDLIEEAEQYSVYSNSKPVSLKKPTTSQLPSNDYTFFKSSLQPRSLHDIMREDMLTYHLFQLNHKFFTIKQDITPDHTNITEDTENRENKKLKKISLYNHEFNRWLLELIKQTRYYPHLLLSFNKTHYFPLFYHYYPQSNDDNIIFDATLNNLIKIQKNSNYSSPNSPNFPILIYYKLFSLRKQGLLVIFTLFEYNIHHFLLFSVLFNKLHHYISQTNSFSHTTYQNAAIDGILTGNIKTLQSYKHILLDEGQDTSYLQQILTLLLTHPLIKDIDYTDAHFNYFTLKNKDISLRNEKNQEMHRALNTISTQMVDSPLENDQNMPVTITDLPDTTLSNTNMSVFIVGDPNQSIYVWRNASLHTFSDLINSFNNSSLLTLTINYRSTADIVYFSHLFIPNVEIVSRDGNIIQTNFKNNHNGIPLKTEILNQFQRYNQSHPDDQLNFKKINNNINQEKINLYHKSYPIHPHVTKPLLVETRDRYQEAFFIIHAILQLTGQHINQNMLYKLKTLEEVNTQNLPQTKKTFTYNDITILSRTQKYTIVLKQLFDVYPLYMNKIFSYFLYDFYQIQNKSHLNFLQITMNSVNSAIAQSFCAKNGQISPVTIPKMSVYHNNSLSFFPCTSSSKTPTIDTFSLHTPFLAFHTDVLSNLYNTARPIIASWFNPQVALDYYVNYDHMINSHRDPTGYTEYHKVLTASNSTETRENASNDHQTEDIGQLKHKLLIQRLYHEVNLLSSAQPCISLQHISAAPKISYGKPQHASTTASTAIPPPSNQPLNPLLSTAFNTQIISPFSEQELHLKSHDLIMSAAVTADHIQLLYALHVQTLILLPIVKDLMQKVFLTPLFANSKLNQNDEILQKKIDSYLNLLIFRGLFPDLRLTLSAISSLFQTITIPPASTTASTAKTKNNTLPTTHPPSQPELHFPSPEHSLNSYTTHNTPSTQVNHTPLPTNLTKHQIYQAMRNLSHVNSFTHNSSLLNQPSHPSVSTPHKIFPQLFKDSDYHDFTQTFNSELTASTITSLSELNKINESNDEPADGSKSPCHSMFDKIREVVEKSPLIVLHHQYQDMFQRFHEFLDFIPVQLLDAKTLDIDSCDTSQFNGLTLSNIGDVKLSYLLIPLLVADKTSMSESIYLHDDFKAWTYFTPQSLVLTYMRLMISQYYVLIHDLLPVTNLNSLTIDHTTGLSNSNKNQLFSNTNDGTEGISSLRLLSIPYSDLNQTPVQLWLQDVLLSTINSNMNFIMSPFSTLPLYYYLTTVLYSIDNPANILINHKSIVQSAQNNPNSVGELNGNSLAYNKDILTDMSLFINNLMKTNVFCDIRIDLRKFKKLVTDFQDGIGFSQPMILKKDEKIEYRSTEFVQRYSTLLKNEHEPEKANLDMNVPVKSTIIPRQDDLENDANIEEDDIYEMDYIKRQRCHAILRLNNLISQHLERSQDVSSNPGELIDIYFNFFDDANISLNDPFLHSMVWQYVYNKTDPTSTNTYQHLLEGLFPSDTDKISTHQINPQSFHQHVHMMPISPNNFQRLCWLIDQFFPSQLHTEQEILPSLFKQSRAEIFQDSLSNLSPNHTNILLSNDPLPPPPPPPTIPLTAPVNALKRKSMSTLEHDENEEVADSNSPQSNNVNNDENISHSNIDSNNTIVVEEKLTFESQLRMLQQKKLQSDAIRNSSRAAKKTDDSKAKKKSPKAISGSNATKKKKLNFDEFFDEDIDSHLLKSSNFNTTLSVQNQSIAQEASNKIKIIDSSQSSQCLNDSQGLLAVFSQSQRLQPSSLQQHPKLQNQIPIYIAFYLFTMLHVSPQKLSFVNIQPPELAYFCLKSIISPFINKYMACPAIRNTSNLSSFPSNFSVSSQFGEIIYNDIERKLNILNLSNIAGKISLLKPQNDEEIRSTSSKSKYDPKGDKTNEKPITLDHLRPHFFSQLRYNLIKQIALKAAILQCTPVLSYLQLYYSPLCELLFTKSYIKLVPLHLKEILARFLFSHFQAKQHELSTNNPTNNYNIPIPTMNDRTPMQKTNYGDTNDDFLGFFDDLEDDRNISPSSTLINNKNVKNTTTSPQPNGADELLLQSDMEEFHCFIFENNSYINTMVDYMSYMAFSLYTTGVHITTNDIIAILSDFLLKYAKNNKITIDMRQAAKSVAADTSTACYGRHLTFDDDDDDDLDQQDEDTLFSIKEHRRAGSSNKKGKNDSITTVTTTTTTNTTRLNKKDKIYQQTKLIHNILYKCIDTLPQQFAQSFEFYRINKYAHHVLQRDNMNNKIYSKSILSPYYPALLPPQDIVLCPYPSPHTSHLLNNIPFIPHYNSFLHCTEMTPALPNTVLYCGNDTSSRDYDDNIQYIESPCSCFIPGSVIRNILNENEYITNYVTKKSKNGHHCYKNGEQHIHEISFPHNDVFQRQFEVEFASSNHNNNQSICGQNSATFVTGSSTASNPSTSIFSSGGRLYNNNKSNKNNPQNELLSIAKTVFVHSGEMCLLETYLRQWSVYVSSPSYTHYMSQITESAKQVRDQLLQQLAVSQSSSTISPSSSLSPSFSTSLSSSQSNQHISSVNTVGTLFSLSLYYTSILTLTKSFLNSNGIDPYSYTEIDIVNDSDDNQDRNNNIASFLTDEEEKTANNIIPRFPFTSAMFPAVEYEEVVTFKHLFQYLFGYYVYLLEAERREGKQLDEIEQNKNNQVSSSLGRTQTLKIDANDIDHGTINNSTQKDNQINTVAVKSQEGTSQLQGSLKRISRQNTLADDDFLVNLSQSNLIEHNCSKDHEDEAELNQYQDLLIEYVVKDFQRKSVAHQSSNKPTKPQQSSSATTTISTSQKITISTIHGAKGLEKPVIFVIGATDNHFRSDDEPRTLTSHEDALIDPTTELFDDLSDSTNCDNLMRDISFGETTTHNCSKQKSAPPPSYSEKILGLEVNQRIDEVSRLLYVACTRARDLLIITFPLVTHISQNHSEMLTFHHEINGYTRKPAYLEYINNNKALPMASVQQQQQQQQLQKHDVTRSIQKFMHSMICERPFQTTSYHTFNDPINGLNNPTPHQFNIHKIFQINPTLFPLNHHSVWPVNIIDIPTSFKPLYLTQYDSVWKLLEIATSSPAIVMRSNDFFNRNMANNIVKHLTNFNESHNASQRGVNTTNMLTINQPSTFPSSSNQLRFNIPAKKPNSSTTTALTTRDRALYHFVLGTQLSYYHHVQSQQNNFNIPSKHYITSSNMLTHFANSMMPLLLSPKDISIPTKIEFAHNVKNQPTLLNVFSTQFTPLSTQTLTRYLRPLLYSQHSVHHISLVKSMFMEYTLNWANSSKTIVQTNPNFNSAALFSAGHFKPMVLDKISMYIGITGSHLSRVKSSTHISTSQTKTQQGNNYTCDSDYDDPKAILIKTIQDYTHIKATDNNQNMGELLKIYNSLYNNVIIPELYSDLNSIKDHLTLFNMYNPLLSTIGLSHLHKPIGSVNMSNNTSLNSDLAGHTTTFSFNAFNNYVYINHIINYYTIVLKTLTGFYQLLQTYRSSSK